MLPNALRHTNRHPRRRRHHGLHCQRAGNAFRPRPVLYGAGSGRRRHQHVGGRRERVVQGRVHIGRQLGRRLGERYQDVAGVHEDGGQFRGAQERAEREVSGASGEHCVAPGAERRRCADVYRLRTGGGDWGREWDAEADGCVSRGVPGK